MLQWPLVVWSISMSLLWPKETTNCLSSHTNRASTTPRFDCFLFITQTCGHFLSVWILSKVISYPWLLSHVLHQVTFRNESSGEYLFYLITFKATSSRVLSTIELVTTVRQAVSATVQVENPLTANVCLSSECKSPDISVPLQHTVPGRSKVSNYYSTTGFCITTPICELAVI